MVLSNECPDPRLSGGPVVAPMMIIGWLESFGGWSIFVLCNMTRIRPKVIHMIVCYCQNSECVCVGGGGCKSLVELCD